MTWLTPCQAYFSSRNLEWQSGLESTYSHFQHTGYKLCYKSGQSLALFVNQRLGFRTYPLSEPLIGLSYLA